MSDKERIANLAALAEKITDQSVYKQFRILGKAGLQLTDINWENCNTDPDATVLIPTAKPKPRSTDHE